MEGNKIEALIKNIEDELITLGYRSKSIIQVPDVINRIEITLRLAQLYYFNRHVLSESDKKWCTYYSHYVHFFDSDRLENLGELYYQLTMEMEQDNCFNSKIYHK